MKLKQGNAHTYADGIVIGTLYCRPAFRSQPKAHRGTARLDRQCPECKLRIRSRSVEAHEDGYHHKVRSSTLKARSKATVA